VIPAIPFDPYGIWADAFFKVYELRWKGSPMKIDEVSVRDDARIEQSRSVSVRLVRDDEGGRAIYISCSTRTSETRCRVPGGAGHQIEPHTDGPFLTFQDQHGGGLTREEWETFKRAGDQAWNEWEARFAAAAQGAPELGDPK
jgi:hypothetical protein